MRAYVLFSLSYQKTEMKVYHLRKVTAPGCMLEDPRCLSL
uniref:Uncharacterized protein n=1 Tax=Anguilla anguilla TaxID=7936 RepID=A0A0E9SIW5_ANGAN